MKKWLYYGPIMLLSLALMGCLQMQQVVMAMTAQTTMTTLAQSAAISRNLPQVTMITATLTPTPTDTPTPTTTLLFTDTPTPSPANILLPQIEPTPIDPNFTLHVPILMYHYISVPPKNADAVRLDLSVTPTQFEQELLYLRQQGYETISMQQLYLAMTLQTPLPAKPIVITFDDGYRDAYEQAFPLLKQYGYKATFFVFTQPIDTYNVDFLTWEMITEMHQAGMEFGSHSYTHPDMRNRDVDFLVYQILGSKEAIEARIGEPVRFFCYPSGRYDQEVIKVLDSAHFFGALTTQWGDAHSFNQRFEMSRLRMRGADSLDKFASVLK
jgi:peptidoglycan/xylan/chitin deacetylase (PgdA/CDA1 family)